MEDRELLTPLRRFLKLFHPEGIPWPGSVLYDRLSATRVFEDLYEHVARNVLTRCSRGRLLDVGTGPGRLLATLHRLAPGIRSTGIDISPAMAARARRNMESLGLREAIDIQEGPLSAIPFPDNTFDVVVSTATIHHWKDPVRALNECHRVLRPGGYALMYDIVSDAPPHILRRMRREFGGLRTTILWIHAFEEPFYSLSAFERLPEGTLFEKGALSFVGILCCLTLEKEIPGIVA